MGLSEITAGKIQEYRIARYQEAAAKREKPPAHSTMHQEVVTLRQTLKTALRHGWLDRLPDLSEPYRSSPRISHRAWFSPEEYKKLYEATRKRAHEPKQARFKWECENSATMFSPPRTRAFVPTKRGGCSSTTWRSSKTKTLDKPFSRLWSAGRGVGYCKSMPGAVVPFKRLKARPRRVASPQTHLHLPAPHGRRRYLLDREELPHLC